MASEQDGSTMRKPIKLVPRWKSSAGRSWGHTDAAQSGRGVQQAHASTFAAARPDQPRQQSAPLPADRTARQTLQKTNASTTGSGTSASPSNDFTWKAHQHSISFSPRSSPLPTPPATTSGTKPSALDPWFARQDANLPPSSPSAHVRHLHAQARRLDVPGGMVDYSTSDISPSSNSGTPKESLSSSTKPDNRPRIDDVWDSEDLEQRKADESPNLSLPASTRESYGLNQPHQTSSTQDAVPQHVNLPADESMPATLPLDQEAIDGRPIERPSSIPETSTFASKSVSDPSSPETLSSFKMPDHVRQQAMLEPLTSPAAYWSHQYYRGPAGQKVTVHYCRSKETTERIAQMFLDSEIIGFDMEWKAMVSAKSHPRVATSLIQIANEERIALFHLALYGRDTCLEDFVAPTLRQILESSSITKVGVSIKADNTRLREALGIESRGLLELSHLYKLVKYCTTDARMVNKRLVSLAVQVQEHLHLPLWKGEDVRSSDWSRELGAQQRDYAASDAYAAVHLYDVLEAKRKALSPTPPRPAFAELGLPIRLTDGGLIDTSEEEVEAVEEGMDESSEMSSEGSSQASDSDEEGLVAAINTLDISESPCPTHSAKSPSTPSLAANPLVGLASDWASSYRTTNPTPSFSNTPRASPSHLRAYYLWHHHSLPIDTVAQTLRDPPLQINTVVSYVLEAVRLERVDYKRERLREVLARLPDGGMGVGRYRRLARAVGME
ncbi:MAG: hypothetical protein M1817_001818 [Caeruleum heppii]|nr:MAG: hypothetical protein M1817_001818 [Caeruleum heppii]